jgi:hypothetical protein
MGYRKVPRVHTLTFEDDENLKGLVIRMRSLKMGELRKFSAIMDSEDDNTLDALPGFLARNVLSWNLEDEYGREIPVGAAAFDEFELEDVLKISEKWMGDLTGPSPDLGKGSPSGEQFPGAPVRMEAL